MKNPEESLKNIISHSKEYGFIFPSSENIFKSLELVAPENVKVVIIGQDPYHNFNQANGLAFSVSRNQPLPPSLKNIFIEIKWNFLLAITAGYHMTKFNHNNK